MVTRVSESLIRQVPQGLKESWIDAEDRVLVLEETFFEGERISI